MPRTEGNRMGKQQESTDDAVTRTEAEVTALRQDVRRHEDAADDAADLARREELEREVQAERGRAELERLEAEARELLARRAEQTGRSGQGTAESHADGV